MKKVVIVILCVLCILGVSSCKKEWRPLLDEETTIRVAASVTPHAEILKAAEESYKKLGYTLIIKEYTDYIQPNLALEDGDVDANFFQHTPYLLEFNEQQHTHLVSVGKVHYEPLAIYKGAKSSLNELKDKEKILIPNDTTNEARALLLLQDAGLITLKENIGLSATKKDVIDNPHGYDLVEMEASQIALNRMDASLAVVNGNYALQAGLRVEDAIMYEATSSIAAKTYANVLVVRDGNQHHKAILALYQILISNELQEFIKNKYKGSVIPYQNN